MKVQHVPLRQSVEGIVRGKGQQKGGGGRELMKRGSGMKVRVERSLSLLSLLVQKYKY